MSPKKIALPLDIYVRVSDVRGRTVRTLPVPMTEDDEREIAEIRGWLRRTVR